MREFLTRVKGEGLRGKGGINGYDEYHGYHGYHGRIRNLHRIYILGFFASERYNNKLFTFLGRDVNKQS